MGIRISRCTLLGLAAVVLPVAGAADARSVVVRSSGPSAKVYPVGKLLADGAKIELAPGDSLILVGHNSTRELRGPGSFAAAQPAVALAANRRSRFGARRTVTLKPSPWNVDVSKSGNVCIADPTKLQIWRWDASQETTLKITGSDGKAAIVRWPAGRSRMAWPSELPTEDGTEYQLQFAEKPEVSRVTLAHIGSMPEDIVTTAQVMIERGCAGQLDVLVNATRDDG